MPKFRVTPLTGQNVPHTIQAHDRKEAAEKYTRQRCTVYQSAPDRFASEYYRPASGPIVQVTPIY